MAYDFGLIRPGDRVTIQYKQGQRRTGRATLCYSTHTVLNMGGPHGRPAVATDANIIKHTPATRRRGNT